MCYAAHVNMVYHSVHARSQDACEVVIDELLSEKPYATRTRCLLLGARAAPSEALAPPGSASMDDMANSKRDGMQANQRFNTFQVRSPLMRCRHDTALGL